MRSLEEHVAHRLGGILYESWTPEQVEHLAKVACDAVEEWHDLFLATLLTRPARRDHTVVEARAYRDGIEDAADIIKEWDASRR